MLLCIFIFDFLLGAYELIVRICNCCGIGSFFCVFPFPIVALKIRKGFNFEYFLEGSPICFFLIFGGRKAPSFSKNYKNFRIMRFVKVCLRMLLDFEDISTCACAGFSYQNVIFLKSVLKASC